MKVCISCGSERNVRNRDSEQGFDSLLTVAKRLAYQVKAFRMPIWPVRLSVRTRDFHSLKRSSTLLPATGLIW